MPNQVRLYIRQYMSNIGYKLTASTGIHKGDREYQQDQVALLSHARIRGCILGIVADGMGGRSGGRKASDQVMMTARQLFERYDPLTDDAAAMLKQVVQEAHLVIKLTAISAEDEPHSTLAAFILNPAGDCHWAHAGDSRIYHYHPKSNIVMGCLGTENEPIVDHHFIAQMRAGDALLACSDGVWHYFNNTELGSVLSTLSAREATEFLIQKARSRARGGGDNLSLIVVKLEPLDE